MGQERRRYPRLVRPLDGKYRGASGGTTCRIADISWGGCFIQTLSEPATGEQTIVTVPVGDRSIDISGRVVYVDRNIGFSVEFDPLSPEEVEALTPLLGPKPD